MASGLRRLEFGGVELLVEIGAAVVGEAVEAAIDALQQPMLTELPETPSSIVTGHVDAGDLTVTRDCSRSHVPLFAEDLKDTVISRLPHPVRVLSHLTLSCDGCAHSITDVATIFGHYPLVIRPITGSIQLVAGKD